MEKIEDPATVKSRKYSINEGSSKEKRTIISHQEKVLHSLTLTVRRQAYSGRWQ